MNEPDKETVESYRRAIQINSQLSALRSILGGIFNKTYGIPERDFTAFEATFKRFTDHYSAEALSILEGYSPELATAVKLVDWSSYDPIEVLKKKE